MEPVKEISRDKVEAASRLFGKMMGWQRAVGTLAAIKKNHCGFSDLDCFIKTAAIDSLYSTNLYDVGLMASHVTAVFSSIDDLSSVDDLVNRIAVLNYPDDKTKWHVSFASKFCHFFVDDDKYPILDSYAVTALTKHDKSFRDCQKDRRYPVFADSAEKVRRLSKISTRKLDCYLWLKGMLMALDDNRGVKLSREFKAIAKNEDDDIRILRAEE